MPDCTFEIVSFRTEKTSIFEFITNPKYKSSKAKLQKLKVVVIAATEAPGFHTSSEFL